MFTARSMPQISGVLGPERGILPALKGLGAKGREKKGLAYAGRRRLSLGLGCQKQGWGEKGAQGFNREKGAHLWESRV